MEVAKPQDLQGCPPRRGQQVGQGKDPLVLGSKRLAAANFKQQPRRRGREFDRRSSDAFAVPRAASTAADPSLGPSGPVLRLNRESLRNQEVSWVCVLS